VRAAREIDARVKYSSRVHARNTDTYSNLIDVGVSGYGNRACDTFSGIGALTDDCTHVQHIVFQPR